MSRVRIPPGPLFIPENTKRLPNEAQLTSVEEERKYAVEMAKEEDAPQKESRQEAEVVMNLLRKAVLLCFPSSMVALTNPSGSMV